MWLVKLLTVQVERIWFFGSCLWWWWLFDGTLIYEESPPVCTDTRQHILFKEDHKVISISRSLLTDNPPSPEKVGHTTGVYVPVCFSSHKNQLSKRAVKRDRLFFVLIRDFITKAAFSSQLRTQSVGPTGLWTYDLPLSRPALSLLS